MYVLNDFFWIFGYQVVKITIKWSGSKGFFPESDNHRKLANRRERQLRKNNKKEYN